MYMKQHILAALSEEFNRWEELLAGMSEAQITAPQLPSNWSDQGRHRPSVGLAAAFHRTGGGCAA